TTENSEIIEQPQVELTEDKTVAPQPQQAETVVQEEKPAVAPIVAAPQVNAKKKNTKKPIIISLIAIIAVLAIAAVAVFMLFGNKSDSKTVAPVVYNTDDELVVVESLGNDEAKTFTVTEDYAGSYMLSPNYKYIVYSENLQKHDDDYDDYEERSTYDIYCKKIGDEKDKGQLIAKNASSISYITGDIDKIYFEKNDDVYVADIEGESKKIAKDVRVDNVIEDGKYFFCTKYQPGKEDEDGNYGDPTYALKYIETETGDVVKISDKAQNYSFDSASEKVYFVQNDNLYSSDKSGDKKSIAKNISDFTVANDKVYYTCLDKEFTYYDFVSDSYADTDSKLSEPNWEDYEPDIKNYEKEKYDDFWEEYFTETDYDAYYKARDKANEKYDADREKYYAALDRIYLRESLKENSYYRTYSLYVFNNGEGKKITDNVSSSYASAIAKLDYTKKDYYTDTVETYIYTTPLDKLKKISIDKVKGVEDVSNYLNKKVKSYAAIATSSEIINLDASKEKMSIYNVRYFDDQYVLCCTKESDKEDDYNQAAVYTLSPNAKSFEDAKLVAEDLYSALYFNGSYITFTDYNEKSNGTTMKVGEQVEDDVLPYGIMYQPGSSDFYYAKDFNEKTRETTICKFSNGESEKIADDVLFSVFGFANVDGKYLVLTDFDIDDGNGTLVCIDGDKKYEIDSNVENIDNGNLFYQNALFHGIDGV
ncbi:MAG: hypothetical protein K2K01_07550, partial [Eubacterium sp.]|nr:hypothetical protein [Eubacterium sp.]